MSSFNITVDLRALEAQVNNMQAQVQANVRPAAQAAAQVLYDRVKLNVAAIGKHTGKLDRAIYQAYSKDNSRPGTSVYHVSWNARKAPHGHLVEFGHLQKYKVYRGKNGNWYTDKTQPIAPKHVAAQPFLRPALSSMDAAMAAAKARLFEGIA